MNSKSNTQKNRGEINFASRFRVRNIIIYLCVIAFLDIQCGKENSQNVKELTQKDILTSHEDIQDTVEQKLIVNYHLLSVKENIKWLNFLKAGDTLNALLILNRVDKKYLVRQDSLIMPDTFVANLGIYSPFPHKIDMLRPVHKIILVSYKAEAFGVYENGIRIRWGATSLGKSSTPTPTGLYFTNWKSKETISSVNDEWVMKWYFNIDNHKGISIHEYGLPGYPESHSCIRLSQDDAYWIYNWADQWVLSSHTKIAAYGTPVVIFGNYPFGKRKPRFSLAEDSKALQIIPKEITSVVNEYIQLILQRQMQRDSLLVKVMVPQIDS